MNMRRVAIVQEPAAVLDLAEGVRRAVQHIANAAKQGAQLVAFPETWLTGYPAWVFGLAGWDDAEARRWHGVLAEQSPVIDGVELVPLHDVAARNQVTVVMGLNERKGAGSGTIYNSLLTIGPDGATLGVHRKLTPTHTERIVWAPAPDGSGIQVRETQVGRLGGLVCWEHWQPLLRQAMHEQAEQVHVAAWPDMTDMHGVAARAYAFEGRCFVLAAAHYLTADDVPPEIRDAYRLGVGPDTPETGEWFPGGSGVVGPNGQWVAAQLFGEPGIIHAEIDLGQTVDYKNDLDVAGHYSRPDILTLTVDRRSRAQVAWVDDQSVNETRESLRNDE
jgi:nitrilase